MRNIIVAVLAVILLVFSLVSEPIEDTIDLIAGATTATHGTSDSYASASHEDDEEDEEEEEEDDD